MKTENQRMDQGELYPSEESSVREDLVRRAASFFQDARLKGWSMEERQKFLISKGLTNKEISIAFELIGEHAINVVVPKTTAAIVAFAKHRVPQLMFFVRRFMKILKTVAVFSSAAYVIYWFYKNHILPYFTHPKPKTAEDHFKDLQETVAISLGQLNSRVDKVRKDVRELVQQGDTRIRKRLEAVSDSKINNFQNVIDFHRVNCQRKDSRFCNNTAPTKQKNESLVGQSAIEKKAKYIQLCSETVAQLNKKFSDKLRNELSQQRNKNDDQHMETQSKAVNLYRAEPIVEQQQDKMRLELTSNLSLLQQTILKQNESEVSMTKTEVKLDSSSGPDCKPEDNAEPISVPEWQISQPWKQIDDKHIETQSKAVNLIHAEPIVELPDEHMTLFGPVLDPYLMPKFSLPHEDETKKSSEIFPDPETFIHDLIHRNNKKSEVSITNAERTDSSSDQDCTSEIFPDSANFIHDLIHRYNKKSEVSITNAECTDSSSGQDCKTEDNAIPISDNENMVLQDEKL